MSFKKWVILKESKNLSVTIVSLYDQHDDSEDLSKQFILKKPSYYYLCLGDPQKVEDKFKNNSEREITLDESKSKFKKSEIVEILINKLELEENIANQYNIHNMKIVLNKGDFLKVI